MMRSAAVVALSAVVACDAPANEVAIESVAPARGPLVGGTRVTIAGRGFDAPARVVIGGREAPLVAVVDDAALDVVIPPGDASGDAEVLVICAASSASATGVFGYSTSPRIERVTPSDIPYDGGGRITVVGSGFLDEDAGAPVVALGEHAVEDIAVASDTELSFMAPPGIALSERDVALANVRGHARLARAIRYVPSTRGGLLLFPSFSPTFATYVDVADGTSVPIARVSSSAGFSAIVADEEGTLWGTDRSRRFGRVDLATQALVSGATTPGWYSTIARWGDAFYAIDRASRQFGGLSLATGTFTPIAAVPCCGSYGLAAGPDALYLVARDSSTGLVDVSTIDPATGERAATVRVTGGTGFHVEDVRFFDGVMYGTSRDGRLVKIDPATGTVTTIKSGVRANAIEVFVPRR